jgi:hypothetical protein
MIVTPSTYCITKNGRPPAVMKHLEDSIADQEQPGRLLAE